MTEGTTLNMSRRRMPITENLFVADRLSHSAVQVQRGNRGASRRTYADGANAVPAKVKSPRVSTEIEQANLLSGFRVASRQLCTFAQRTGDASQGEIVESHFTTRVDRSDVVNVEGHFLRGLGEAAIFAAILRPMNDLTPKMRRDRHVVNGVRCSIVANADGAGKEDRQDQPSLRPRISRRLSGGRLGLVCRANRGSAFAHLWADETLLGRPASQLSVRWLETYSLSVSGFESNRTGSLCPSPEIPYVKTRGHSCPRS